MWWWCEWRAQLQLGRGSAGAEPSTRTAASRQKAGQCSIHFEQNKLGASPRGPPRGQAHGITGLRRARGGRFYPCGMPPSPSVPSAPARAWSGWIMFSLMLLAALAAYHPALHGAFLWDDSGHVTRADLRSLSGLGRIWFELGATQQYYPLLHSAFWLEHKLWGDATLGYHLVNVLQHAAAATLFGLLLRRLAVPGAWLAAAVFALVGGAYCSLARRSDGWVLRLGRPALVIALAVLMGVPLFGPAGVGIWNAPTVDAKRGLIYSGTGPAYAGDEPETTDAVVAPTRRRTTATRSAAGCSPSPTTAWSTGERAPGRSPRSSATRSRAWNSRSPTTRCATNPFFATVFKIDCVASGVLQFVTPWSTVTRPMRAAISNAAYSKSALRVPMAMSALFMASLARFGRV